MFGIILSLLGIINTLQGEELSPQEILKRVDEIRGGGNSVILEADITTYVIGEKEEQAKFEILSKYQEQKTLIKSLYPPRDKGKFMLMLEDDFWIYLPQAKRPFRISPLQRFLGGVTYADIARPTYSGDYNVESLREKLFEDTEYYILELKAKNKKVAYHRVDYWVEKKTFHPVRAYFYTLSGKLMKTAFFEDYVYKKDLKKFISTKLKIIDQINKNKETVIVYTKIEPQEIPDKIFSREYLEKRR